MYRSPEAYAALLAALRQFVAATGCAVGVVTDAGDWLTVLPDPGARDRLAHALRRLAADGPPARP